MTRAKRGHNSTRTCAKCKGDGGVIITLEQAEAATLAAGSDAYNLLVPIEDVIKAFRDAPPGTTVIGIECDECDGNGG